ncbi:dUTP diphosphatase [Candidatus Pacearchaeota archaeon]|jgi:dUTP pyrophosphatase|nr:dUTP diphosphatase [Candidatus Pacearchaeota archaeon]
MLLQYFRIYPNVKFPTRAHPSDAGIDVYWCPQDNIKSIILKPGENYLFGTGIKFCVEHGYMLQVMNRGSMAAKKGLVYGAHLIDAGYNGEVFIDLHNISNKEVEVKCYDKIAQLVLVPVISCNLIESFDDNLYDDAFVISNRDDSCLGSSDKK